jgi:hypothetical protein
MVDKDSYRIGFEAAIELSINEIRHSETKEIALAKLYEFMSLVKDDKIERVKEMLWAIKR